MQHESRTKAKEEDDDIKARMRDLETRITFLEASQSNSIRSCKLCDERIDGENTNRESLLAELCDECYQLQNDDMP